MFSGFSSGRQCRVAKSWGVLFCYREGMKNLEQWIVFCSASERPFGYPGQALRKTAKGKGSFHVPYILLHRAVSARSLLLVTASSRGQQFPCDALQFPASSFCARMCTIMMCVIFTLRWVGMSTLPPSLLKSQKNRTTSRCSLELWVTRQSRGTQPTSNYVMSKT